MPTRGEWKDLLPVVQAFVDGKTIQFSGNSGWRDLETLCFNYQPDRYRIKPEPTANDYIAAQAECGLKVGDWVRITRSAEEGEQGWRNVWNPLMTKYVGEIGQVSRLTSGGLMVKFPNSRDNFQFPYFVLEKTDQPYRHFKSGDEFVAALAAQSLPMIVNGCGEYYSVSSIKDACAAIGGVVKYWDELLTKYKFADGSPCGVPIEL